MNRHKTILATALSAMVILPALNATVPVEVRETTELVSALARTAGFMEYINNSYPEYTAMIDSALTPYKDHPAILFIQEQRDSGGVAYDAIADFAATLKIIDGNVVFNPDLNIDAMTDNRWKNGSMKEMVPLLNDFYHVTSFADIYRKGAPIYEKAIEKFNEMQQNIDYEWLKRFYGRDVELSAILSMLNRGNYGITEHYNDGREYAVMEIGPSVNREGMPDYTGLESLIIHEGSHPVTNPFIKAHSSEFNANSDSIAHLFATELSRQAYGTGETVLAETMVRTAEVRYALDHATTERDSMLARVRTLNDKLNGFLFIEDFVNELDRYEANRDKYPTLGDFMPELVALHNRLDVDSVYNDAVSRQPKFLGANIEDNAVVPPGPTTITIRFSQPIFMGQGIGPYNADGRVFPSSEDASTSWNDDRTEFSYHVTLEPGKHYGLAYWGTWFKNKDGYPTQAVYILPFDTSEE